MILILRNIVCFVKHLHTWTQLSFEEELGLKRFKKIRKGHNNSHHFIFQFLWKLLFSWSMSFLLGLTKSVQNGPSSVVTSGFKMQKFKLSVFECIWTLIILIISTFGYCLCQQKMYLLNSRNKHQRNEMRNFKHTIVFLTSHVIQIYHHFAK